MAFSDIYKRQVAQLIRTLPIIAKEPDFALKGGTAINLFFRDMPRLSVDIDLTFLPIRPWADSLRDIDAAMKRMAGEIRKAIKSAQVTPSALQAEGMITKLLVRADGVQSKIEVTPVLRGCVYDPQLRAVSKTVEETFGFAEAPLVSFADAYGGKIVAALDRQHPRDLFDVRELLAAQGIDDSLRRSFIVYLLSHNRPMSEVLAPTRKDISGEFSRGFQGMTEQSVTLDDLLNTRETLIQTIVGGMPDAHRRFLISFERGAPEWPLLKVAHAPSLPAIAWRQKNLNDLDPSRRATLVARLEEVVLG